MRLKEDLKFQKGMQSSQHLDCSLVETRIRGPTSALPGLLSHTNYEYIYVC